MFVLLVDVLMAGKTSFSMGSAFTTGASGKAFGGGGCWDFRGSSTFLRTLLSSLKTSLP